jgi:sensor histidine kinase regulating citrate/malate metabolism
MKARHFTQAENYIENLYQNVSYINNLLKIYPPELAAILNVKQEEAKREGIVFKWQVSIDNNILPICSKELTHIVGNLLENAFEAVKEIHEPKVDFFLTCNNLGLELKLFNNGKSISADIKNTIFDIGYTTKDKQLHSGLGLYIINQIVKSNGGSISINEPDHYEGVQFAIYIPWKK